MKDALTVYLMLEKELFDHLVTKVELVDDILKVISRHLVTPADCTGADHSK